MPLIKLQSEGLNLADNFAFFAFWKKYLTFFLWIISITVPTSIKIPISITNDCIKIAGTLWDKIKNGFVEIIMMFLPLVNS